MTNELFELARRRRSCRRFTGEKISDEIVDEILKVALLAPSSWGGHPIVKKADSCWLLAE